jgi:hypothetical protein
MAVGLLGNLRRESGRLTASGAGTHAHSHAD